ncbi:MAG: hypothetical protein NTZ74_01980 [Chloroflexi bacterium]|nr:hypothetical protein [Chloroflexota bacterium]
MLNLNFEYLLLLEKSHEVERRGYVWKVIVDPTREGYEPGMFYGGLFRMADIRVEREEKSNWPEGIIFEHIYSQCRLSYQKGLLKNLTTTEVFQKKERKVRHRNRTSSAAK